MRRKVKVQKRMSAKRKHEAAEEEEEEEGEDESEDEAEDLVSMMATTVQVCGLNPEEGLVMALPYDVFVPPFGQKTAKVAVEVGVHYLEGEGNWKKQESSTFKLDNPKGEECVAMRFTLRLDPASLPPNDDGRKAGVPVSGPSLLSVWGPDTTYLNYVGENSCSIVLPMLYMPKTVDGYYKLEVFYKDKTAWEKPVEGKIIKLVKGDVNNARPLMVEISFDRIYA